MTLARVLAGFPPADYHALTRVMPLREALPYLTLRAVNHAFEKAERESKR